MLVDGISKSGNFASLLCLKLVAPPDDFLYSLLRNRQKHIENPITHGETNYYDDIYGAFVSLIFRTLASVARVKRCPFSSTKALAARIYASVCTFCYYDQLWLRRNCDNDPFWDPLSTAYMI